MRYSKEKNNGMELLIRHYRKQFETEENLNHYSKKDFATAKRKFLKHVLSGSLEAHAN